MLIDGDNAQPSLIEKMLAEAGKHGMVTVRRIYGDWTEENMKGWKERLHNFAIQPIQQFRYTTGKNATDSAMIIDAMDILHSKSVEGFCIVSSDSDYTRLATRIRESGVFVMGIGRKNTPKSFVNACALFTYTENFEPIENGSKENQNNSKKKGTKEKPIEIIYPLDLIKEAFDTSVREDGWANLAAMGTYLIQLDPGFDPRTYKFKQLSQLLEATGLFEFKMIGDKRMFVKMKHK